MLVIAGVVFIVILAALILVPRGKPPATLGIRDGHLAPCPDRPNCVSSSSRDPRHFVDPITFTAEPAAAMQAMKALVGSMPRTKIVTATGHYIHAECRTRLLRFTDDLEILLDREARVFHVRSASRIGYSDLGVNWKRVETIRRRWREAVEREEPDSGQRE